MDEDDVAMSRWARSAQVKPLQVGETQRWSLKPKHYDYVMDSLGADPTTVIILSLIIRRQKIRAKVIEIKERPYVKFEIVSIEKMN